MTWCYLKKNACRKPLALSAFEPQSQGAAGGSCFFRSWIHLRCCIPLLLVHTGKIADALGIPVGAQLTPGSLRPGGTIHLNHSGLAIADLMWRLRLRQISTLESYLQETGASNVLASLPLKVKHNVRHCAQMLPHQCKVFIPRSSLA